ncbi:MAG: bifunctional phosphoribosylaminoimidazolecarboxamide formyltransferase/IMP cyclohydrolase, partial [Pseudomonadota bacterium]
MTTTSNDDRVTVRRALLSVSDKTNLIALAQRLTAANVELVSTGGSAKTLREAGLAVRDVSELTGFPEMMDGRVKTLHPGVHGGLLARRDDPAHITALADHDIAPIDLLVVNLYPFEETVRAGADVDTVIENIDIGGPAMIRAAAKNHAGVAVIVEPVDYDAVASEIAEHGGISAATRKRLFGQRPWPPAAF